MQKVICKFLFVALYFLAEILSTGHLNVLIAQSVLPLNLHYRLTELKRENRFDEALALLDSFTDTLDSQKEARSLFEATLLKADIYRINGQNGLSAKLLDSLILWQPEICEENDPLTGQLFIVQGTLFLNKGELKKGRKAIEKAIKIYSLNFGPGDTLLCPCYNKLGNYYYFQKNYDSAMVWYTKALELNDKKLNNLEDRASYIQNLGIIYLELNDYSKAEKCFLESLRIKESIFSPNSYSLGRLYLNLGRFYQDITALDQAMIYISKAEKIYSINLIPAALELGSIYWNKGLIYYLSEDSESALTYLFSAKKIIDSVFAENQQLIASLNSDIGNVYSKSGQYDKAIYYYNKTLGGADSLLIKKTYRNLAFLYLLERDFKQAEYYYQQLLQASKNTLSIKNPDNALTYLNYGYYLLESGNDSALYYLNTAFKLFNENYIFHNREVATSLSIIGEYYASKDKLIQALQYFQQSLITISASFTDTNIYSNPEIESMKPDVRVINALSQKAICLNKCFAKYGNINYLVAAARTFQLSFDLTDQLWMTLKAEDSQYLLQGGLNWTYNKAINNCLELYEYTKDEEWLHQAFKISERGKSIVLLNELRDFNAKKIGLIPEELIKYEKEIKSNLYLYRNNIWEEENEAYPDEKKLYFLRYNLLAFEQKNDSLRNYFEVNYPEYYRLKYDPSIVNVGDLQDILDDNEAIIEYTLSENSVFIFYISSGHFEVKKIDIDSTLIKGIFILKNNLDFQHVPDYNYQDYMEYQLTANKLYSILIQPVEGNLDGKKIIFIPDEELNFLSFESLVQRIIPSDTISFRNLPYLIKKCPVSYAPSAAIFALIKKGRAPVLNRGVLALAPSTSMITASMLANNEALALQIKDDLELPGAMWEVDKILKIMKGKKLVGVEATEAEFKKLASSYDILHFATHTFIDDNNQLSSMLSFYPYGGSGEDGVLHTYEIYNLALKGELAVLSACSTGDGKLLKGEGVISLARAFAYAGMPSVIMTLWDVEDVSTGNIVPLFYHLLNKGYEKDAALRLSKLDYLERTKSEIETHPAFWSGFVLYGNNRGFRQKIDDIFIIFVIALGGLIILISFVLLRKYFHFRKNSRPHDTDLPFKFQPEDGL